MKKPKGVSFMFKLAVSTRLRGGAMRVPFFDLPQIDGFDALMSFDRETAKRHKCFARPYHSEDRPRSATKQMFTSLPTITVVRQVEPGIRCRRFLAINPENEGREVLIPDNLFDYENWRAV